MILKRYCIDCGKIEPPEGTKCCPGSRVFWIEKDAAERINDMERGRGNTFDELLAKLNKAECDLAQMTAWRDAAHIDREREERECLQAMEERDRYRNALELIFCLPGDATEATLIASEALKS